MDELSWEALAASDTLPEFVDEPLTVTDFVRYQGASGDLNPIHHDERFARSAGFPGVFAVGMLAAGILGSYLADLFGPRAIRRFKVQFREQAWPGDVLTYRGVVTEREERDGERLARLELLVLRQTGGVHAKGWATVALP
ncbi:MaoC/PaaZ C-terminal domain-containing protein [Rugosimonospora acidiphila]